MNNLDDVKRILAQGDKEGAIKKLASVLRLNGNDVEAWLLLGEIIDDSAKKRDCYNQVLKLSPNNPIALNGLRELEISQLRLDLGSPNELREAQPKIQGKPTFKIASPDDPDPWAEFRRKSTALSSNKSEPKINNTTDNSKGDQEIIKYVIWGILAIVGIVYFVGISNSSGNSDPVCTGAFFLAIIGGIFIWYLSSKNRSTAVNNAIQEQRHSHSSPSSGYSTTSPTVSCRVCQHAVSRTAPSCPNCGELYPGLISKCPNCGSSNIRITPKGFSLGKAAAGAVIAGPLGVAGGLHGRKDLEVKCSSCNRIITIKSNEIS